VARALLLRSTARVLLPLSIAGLSGKRRIEDSAAVVLQERFGGRGRIRFKARVGVDLIARLVKKSAAVVVAQVVAV
jgi:hypothetical protein